MRDTSSSFTTTTSSKSAAVSLSEVISAMTFALDLTEGAVPGHGLRTCLLGMRLAESLALSGPMRASLYYALQLKDVGCSSNAARVCQMTGGDDRAMKAASKLTDWDHPQDTVRSIWRVILPGRNFFLRGLRLLSMGMFRKKNSLAMIELRCERGAEILRQLKMGEVAAEAVRRLDENWDGTGYPSGLKGSAIPLLARICSVAQNLDVFAMQCGEDTAIRVLEKRSGTCFDPDIVRLARTLHDRGTLWMHCRADDNLTATRHAVVDFDPGMRAELVPKRIDEICEAFASVVDAKSPFTYRHSQGVADLAVELAEEMEMSPDRVQIVRRAALLHDIGKLIVPNSILDKNGKLTQEEWAIVSAHPHMTRTILERVSLFREVAAIAGEHHERLDGSGYPRGLYAASLSTESRLLALADSFSALAEERPYRHAVPPREILSILEPHVPAKLDAECFEALKKVVGRWADADPMGVWATAAAPPQNVIQQKWELAEA